MEGNATIKLSPFNPSATYGRILFDIYNCEVVSLEPLFDLMPKGMFTFFDGFFSSLIASIKPGIAKKRLTILNSNVKKAIVPKSNDAVVLFIYHY